MNTQLLGTAFLAVLVYMSFWFAVAKALKKLSVVDVAWGTGFVIVAWLTAISESSARSWLIAILVTLWGIRITNHLARRVFKHRDDPRYEEITKKWHGNYWLRAYLSIFVLQGVLVVLISLPVMVAANEQNPDLGVLSVLGAALWAVGFMLETLADMQLRDFLADPRNRGDVMDQGLWKYSRHPNYFGELLQWWAIAIIALQVNNGWIGLLGPLTLTILIVFVSGIPPIERKKKSDPIYADYMKRTSPLIPLPPRRGQPQA